MKNLKYITVDNNPNHNSINKINSFLITNKINNSSYNINSNLIMVVVSLVMKKNTSNIISIKLM